MKFILILNICSAVHLNCLPTIYDSFIFNSWKECAIAGYQRSIDEINKIDNGIVNRNKVLVNFKCEEVKES